jgi:hypothetical protein
MKNIYEKRIIYSIMTHVEFDKLNQDNISKNFYNVIIEDLLDELKDYDYRYVGVTEARFYAVLYATLKIDDTLISLDIAINKKIKNNLLNEHERWHKAYQQAVINDYYPLAAELEKDAESLIRKEPSSGKGNSLFELGNLILKKHEL